ncbi:MAG: hypothetical protein ACKVKF_22035 [Rhodobacterales bacterium]
MFATPCAMASDFWAWGSSSIFNQASTCGTFQKSVAEMVIGEAAPDLCLKLEGLQLLSGFPDPDRFDLLPTGSSASHTFFSGAA